MKFTYLGGRAGDAYFAGRYAASRDHWMCRARDAEYPEVRKIFVRGARDAHHDYLRRIARALGKIVHEGAA